MHFGFLVFIDDDLIMDEMNFEFVDYIIKNGNSAWCVRGFVKLYELQDFWRDFLKVQK